MLLTTEIIQEAHSTHIQAVMMKYVLEVLESMEYSDIQFLSSVLPGSELSVTDYVEHLNSHCKCTLSINGMFVFDYGLCFEVNKGRLIESYWIKGKDDQRYFSSGLEVQTLPWSLMQESIRFRLVTLIEGTIPHITYATQLLKVFLDLNEVHFIDLDQEYYYFQCSGPTEIKISEIGTVSRRTMEEAGSYILIGHIEDFILFSATRMKVLLERDKYLQLVYSNKIKTYEDCLDAEYRVLELLFYSFVVEDSIMTYQYKGISGVKSST